MSPYAWLAAVVIAAVALGGTHWKVYSIGKQVSQSECQQEKLAALATAEEGRLLAQKSINAIDTKSVKKKQKQAVADRSIIEQVDKNVPSTLPMLPGGFRLLHDAAAAGQKIDDTAKADADPVAPGTVAKTIARNYQSGREDKTNLEDLQAIVRASGCFAIEGE